MEIWKDIVGYDGKYQVSNYGRVKRKYIIINNQYGSFISTKEKILKPFKIGKKNYSLYHVHLSHKGITKHKLLHRLVSNAFIENTLNKPCVNHIDFDTSNNNVTNLEWCTYKENSDHSCLNNRKGKYINHSIMVKLYKKHSLTEMVELTGIGLERIKYVLLHNGVKLRNRSECQKLSYETNRRKT